MRNMQRFLDGRQRNAIAELHKAGREVQQHRHQQHHPGIGERPLQRKPRQNPANHPPKPRRPSFPPLPPFRANHPLTPYLPARPSPSFRRRPESRTPVRRRPQIPAFARMTVIATPITHTNKRLSPFPPYCLPPSFPRKWESTPRPIDTPGLTGVLDSGLRRNDGRGGADVGRGRGRGGVGGSGRFSLTQPSPAGRGPRACAAIPVCRLIPAARPAVIHISSPSFPPSPPPFPRKRESTPPPIDTPGIPGFWIPACAGMTVWAAAFRIGLTRPAARSGFPLSRE